MFRLPFELFLALRYLRPKRTFVSVITLISILGVALGVAVLIIVISVMSGFDHDLREKILGFKPHVTVVHWDPSMRSATPMNNYDMVADAVAQTPDVLGVSPFITGPVLVETEGGENRPALQDAPMLRGIDLARENKAYDIRKMLVSGTNDLSGRGLLVGVDFANNLGLAVGDRLSIYSARELKKMKTAHEQKQDTAILPDEYEVRGIFDAGYYEYNARFVVVSLENAQDIYDLDDAVHGLFVTLKNPDNAGVVKRQLLLALDANYSVASWMDMDSGLLSAIAVEKNVMFIILFFIVLVAALCILSAQITFVVQKTREIGMLKALGASNAQISGIFLGQSAIIGVIGVAAGFGLGMLAVAYRNEFLHFLRQATGWELFPASIYGFGDLPALITPSDVVIICIGSFIICVIGGVLPAIRAGRLKPVEALRYE
jgi:lipoprotein-releasing system permease protein